MPPLLYRPHPLAAPDRICAQAPVYARGDAIKLSGEHHPWLSDRCLLLAYAPSPDVVGLECAAWLEDSLSVAQRAPDPLIAYLQLPSVIPLPWAPRPIEHAPESELALIRSTVLLLVLPEELGVQMIRSMPNFSVIPERILTTIPEQSLGIWIGYLLSYHLYGLTLTAAEPTP